jgi:hypothetical protein
MPRGIGYSCCKWRGRGHSNLNERPYRAACLKLKDADGYIVSCVSQKGVVVAPRIAPWCGS